MKKNTNTLPNCKARSRVWLAVVYDLNKVNEAEMLSYSRIVGFLASPLHDKDVFDEDKKGKDENGNDIFFHRKGDLKTPHYHLIVKFANPTSFNGALYEIQSYISDQNVRVEVCKEVLDCIDYLTHYGFDDKYQYHQEGGKIAQYGDCSYFEKVQNRSDENYQFVADLISCTPYEMSVKYGRDYIRNYRKYNEFAHLLANTDCIPDEHSRFKEWLHVYQPEFERANLESFRKFEKQNGMFI